MHDGTARCGLLKGGVGLSQTGVLAAVKMRDRIQLCGIHMTNSMQGRIRIVVLTIV